MKYIAYCRKSREEQDKQILSIEAQIAELQDFAKRENLEISEFITEAKTAKVPGREQFAQVLKKIEKGLAGGIVAWHPDRLARNSIDGGKIIYLLDTGKLRDLKFPSFWFENTPQGKFMLSIAFGQSKYYVDNLSENVKRGIRQKIRNGVWPSKAPLGYFNEPRTRTIEVHSGKAKLVKRAYQLFAEGGKTFVQISKFLAKSAITKRSGKPLGIDQVRHLLSNKFYVGILKLNDEYFEASHKLFISKDLFARVQKELKLRDRHKSRKYQFAFMGLMKCGECGATVTAEIHNKYYKTTDRSAEYIYYRCTKKLGPCKQKYIPEPELEKQVREKIESVSLPQSVGKQWLIWARKDEKLDRKSVVENILKLKQNIQDNDEKLNKLLDGYLEGVIEPEIYKQKKNEIFETKIEIQQDLAQIEEKGSAWLEPFREFVESALQAQKIARAKNTNEELAFFAKTVGSNFFLMNRQLSASFKTGFPELERARPALAPAAASCGDSFLVGVAGLEPATSRPPAWRSSQLNYTPCLIILSPLVFLSNL